MVQTASFFQSIRHEAVVSVVFLISSLFLYLLARICYNVFFHPLRSYPGPFLLKISCIPLDYHTYRGHAYKTVHALHSKYGPVVRVGPNELSFTDSQAVRDIYNHAPGRPEFPKLFFARAPNGLPSILSANKDDHARYRRLLSHAFSEKGLRSQESRISSFVDLLVDRLRERADSREVANMSSWYEMTTFDVIGDLALSESFGSLENRVSHEWIPATSGNLIAGFKETVLTRYGLQSLKTYLIPKQNQELRTRNYQYTQTLLEQRTALGGDRGDFWDRVMIKSEDDNRKGEGMTKPEMVVNASVLVLAGSETSATTLSGITYLLLCNPSAMQKITQEIRSSFQSSEDITIFSTATLKYTFAVIEEALRVYPPVPRMLARTVPKGGASVNGKWLPENVIVSTPQYAQSFMPSNFHRANEFLPERWLDGPESDEFADDDKGAFNPFSVGFRNCIGRNLAYAEIRLILVKVLWHFDFELDEKRTGDWFDQKAWGVWSRRPLWVRLSTAQR